MFFRFFRRVGIILGFIYYKLITEGLENIPKEGAFLFCSNHISALDPLAITVALKRQPRFMAKVELFKFPPFAWFFRKLGAFPINRTGTDVEAYKKTINILKSGQGMIIFSQGTRLKDFEGAKGGVALFALKTGTPIIPAFIKSTYKFRSVVSIKIGEPILMDKYKDMKIKTELIEEVMAIVTEKVNLLGAAGSAV